MNRRKVAIGTALATLAAAAFLVIAGLHPLLVVVLAAVVVVTGGLVTLFADPDEPSLPAFRTRIRGGARREVTQSAWTLGGARGRVAASGSEQLRRIAAHRLQLRGIDLAAPQDRAAAEEALGPLAHAVVSRPAERPVEVFRAAVAAVDRLSAPSSSEPHRTADPARRTA